jgi:hypothetical protein
VGLIRKSEIGRDLGEGLAAPQRNARPLDAQVALIRKRRDAVAHAEETDQVKRADLRDPRQLVEPDVLGDALHEELAHPFHPGVVARALAPRARGRGVAPHQLLERGAEGNIALEAALSSARCAAWSSATVGSSVRRAAANAIVPRQCQTASAAACIIVGST